MTEDTTHGGIPPTGTELKRRMIGAWLVALVPLAAVAAPFALTTNPPARSRR